MAIEYVCHKEIARVPACIFEPFFFIVWRLPVLPNIICRYQRTTYISVYHWCLPVCKRGKKKNFICRRHELFSVYNFPKELKWYFSHFKMKFWWMFATHAYFYVDVDVKKKNPNARCWRNLSLLRQFVMVYLYGILGRNNILICVSLLNSLREKHLKSAISRGHLNESSI